MAHEPVVVAVVRGDRAEAAQLRALDELQRALITQDAQAYTAMTEAGRAARKDPSARAAHQQAVLKAVAVPMEMATVALSTLALMDDLKANVSRYMISDLGVAAVSAWAAVEAASYMVQVNLPEVDDADIRDRMARDIRDLCKRSDAHHTSLRAFVVGRFN